MLPMADGSDLGGSLRNPAGWNNVFGFRPSQGRVPGWPRRDAFHAQLVTEGPIARSAADLAVLLKVQSGYDPRVPLSLAEPAEDWAAPLDVDLGGRRVAWLGDLAGHLPMEPGVLSVCDDALALLEASALTVDPVSPTFDWARLWRSFVVLRQFGLGESFGPAFADPDLRALMKPEFQWELSEALKLTVADVQRAAVDRTQWYDAVLALFEEHDYVALPSAQVFPFPIEDTWPTEVAGRAMDSYHRWMEVSVPGTLSGCPVVSIPAGFGGAHDLPMGLQMIGRPRDDRSLLQLARWWEQRAPWVQLAPPEPPAT
jgi:amidase